MAAVLGPGLSAPGCRMAPAGRLFGTATKAAATAVSRSRRHDGCSKHVCFASGLLLSAILDAAGGDGASQVADLGGSPSKHRCGPEGRSVNLRVPRRRVMRPLHVQRARGGGCEWPG